jgi:hypothetical protein
LTFDGRALHQDDRWCTAVVELFSSMARRLGALYAAATVSRNVIARRGLWYDSQSEMRPRPTWRSFFIGLPPRPTWLAWFGRAYAPYVAGALEGHAEQTNDGAWLFRGGPRPMDVDELSRNWPLLPARPIFTPRRDETGNPSPVPAELIPRGH